MRRRPTLKGVNTLSERFAPRLFRGISAPDPADGYHPMLIGGTKRGDARGDVLSVHTLRLDPNNPHNNWARSWKPYVPAQTNTGVSGQTQSSQRRAMGDI